jgi:hypothetical protein
MNDLEASLAKARAHDGASAKTSRDEQDA